MLKLPGLPMPFLAILGREPEEMGWGTEPERVLPFLPPGGRCEILDDVGHFVHIEQPELVAGAGARPSSEDATMSARPTVLRHNRVTLALHQLRARRRPAAAVPARARRGAHRRPCRRGSTAWTGPVAALDFTGHGAVDDPDRRRLHVGDPAGRRRHRPRRARPGDGVRPRSRRLRRPDAGRRSPGRRRRRGARRRSGARRRPDVPDVAELLRPRRRRTARPTRMPSSS